MSYETIQELKQRESELAQLRHEQAQLKTTLQKKERLLAQTQLQMLQTEKMSSLGEMLAGITHEINNPINFISGGIRCLDEYMQDISKLLVLYERYYQDVPPDIQTLRDEVNVDYLLADTQKLLASMRQTAEILKNISRSVRNFARADQPGKVNINLHDGIETALMILSFRLKAAPSRPAIQIHRQYGELPLVTAYPTQMNQVFLNILVNAIDALEEANEGREYLEIEAHPNQIWITTQYHAEQSVVQVKIRDNGGGVPESIQEQVFDNLFTTKSRDRGTGIGLFISRQIVEESHQGHLHFTSALGEGTEFIIELPVQ
jgi:signal transduction histidine kinase